MKNREVHARWLLDQLEAEGLPRLSALRESRLVQCVCRIAGDEILGPDMRVLYRLTARGLLDRELDDD